MCSMFLLHISHHLHQFDTMEFMFHHFHVIIGFLGKRIFLILFDQNTPLKIRKNALCILHMKFKCLPISFAYNFDMKSTQFHYDCIVPNVNREFVKIGMDVCAIVLHLSPWTRVLKLSASCHDPD
eukprot:318157_1